MKPVTLFVVSLFISGLLLVFPSSVDATSCLGTWPGQPPDSVAGQTCALGKVHCDKPPGCTLPSDCQSCKCPGGLVSCVVGGEASCQASQEGQLCNYPDGGAAGNDGKQDKCGACVSCADGFIDCRSNNQGCLTTDESNSLKANTSCPAGQAPNACGVCETISYTPAYLDYYTPQSGALNITGQVRVGQGASPPVTLGAGALYYKTGANAGLKVSDGSAWQDVGKVYTGAPTQIAIDTTTNTIGFVSDPIVAGNLTVGTSAPLPLFVDVANKRVTVQNFNALDKVKLMGNVGIGGVNNTSKKFLVLGEGEISNDWKAGSLTLGNVTKSAWPTGMNDQIIVDNTTNKIGFVVNPKVSGNLKVNGSGGFGAYDPDQNWRISTPNLYVGAGAGLKGTIIGAGADQTAGDIKTDGRLIVAGDLKKLQSGTADCPSGTVWIDFNGNSTKQDGECYDAPDNGDVGHGVFGGRLNVSRMLSALGGLTVAGSTTILDPNNLVVASGNITAKQLNLTQKLTIAPTPDATVAEQYALRVVDNGGQEWFSVKRTGSVGNASVNADTIQVSTLGSFSAPKLSTSSRFDTPILAVNAADILGLPSGVKFLVSGDSELQGKLTVVGEFNIDLLKTPTVHFESTSNPFHIEGDEALRIQPDVELTGRLFLKNAVKMKTSNNSEFIIEDNGKINLQRISDISFNESNEGSLILMAKNGISCTTVCNYHKLSCDSNVGVVRFDTFNGNVIGTSCSNTTDRRICPCGGPGIQ